MKNFEFNGKFYGINIDYYVGCDIFFKCNYKNDKKEGEYISYNENGEIYKKCYYKMTKEKENIFYMMGMVEFMKSAIIKMEY
jgi:antitoxin component YwqK of YwqJK toxin-antitoxin module